MAPSLRWDQYSRGEVVASGQFGRWLTVGASLLLLAGCATHSWAPGPAARGTLEQAQGQCRLMARHSGGGFYASGTQQFVAGAMLGAAVGDAIRANDDFNDCMMASGWVVADKQPQAQAYAPQAVAPSTDVASSPPSPPPPDNLAIRSEALSMAKAGDCKTAIVLAGSTSSYGFIHEITDLCSK